MFNNIKEPSSLIQIPIIDNYELYKSNRGKAERKNLEYCPCCGKAIKKAKFHINSIYGGMAYPASDKDTYSDSWVMAVGTECRKKFPEGYVFTLPSNEDSAEVVDQVEIDGFSDEAQVKCYDGYAIATSANRLVRLTYPKLSELSEEDKSKVLNYVGVSSSDEVRFSDVMLMYGKPATEGAI
jgi:hypothetical protein